MSHINSGRLVRVVVRDAALRVLADGERAVVRLRQARIPLIARRADIYQSAVERREARVADVVLMRARAGAVARRASWW